MDWIRAHYERGAVLAAAVFLLVCAIFICLSTGSFKDRFATLQNAPAPNNKIPEGGAPALAHTMHRLQTPPQWTFSGRSGLFVPEKHFIGANGEPATLQNTMLHPPVPNEWIEEFGLPITDGDVLTQDADGDGFTNLEEWSGHTNPIEKESHPPYTSMLKLKSFTQEQFPLIFTSTVEDTYAINNIDRSKPTQFLKVGDLVQGTKYNLTGYTEKFDTDQYGTRIDVSELALEQIDTHDKITLVKEKTATSPEAVATFLYTWGETDQTFTVKKDQEFTLKPLEEIKYKLLDVQPDKAIISNTKTPNEKIEIPLLKP